MPFRMEFQSAPKSIALKEAIVPPKLDGPPESNPNKQSSLFVYSLCDPPQNYLESNASWRRSGFLSHKKAPRRKNHCPKLRSHRIIFVDLFILHSLELAFQST
jgi:hypothetical protein